MRLELARLSAAALRALALLAIAAVFFARSAVAENDEDVFPSRSPPPPVHRAPAPKPATAPTVEAPKAEPLAYKIQPGDILIVSVWKETDLQTDVVVRPDGGFSFPLAGDIPAAGHTIEEVRAMLGERLSKYISDPVVTVAIKQIGGNHIYVVGKVNKPGEFPLSGPIDVMQALGLAGGATPFASLNDIRVIRREDDRQIAIRFRYHDIENGRGLDQNILLHSGDTVVVP
jgi:polysaccharide export outer membrane protein